MDDMRRLKIIQKMDMGLDAKDVSELQGMTFKDKMLFMLLSSWVLNKWYEKALLFIFFFLGLWKILNFFGFFL